MSALRYEPDDTHDLLSAEPWHGTEAGYYRHQRRGESACEACREGHRLKIRERRARGPVLTEPVSITALLAAQTSPPARAFVEHFASRPDIASRIADITFSEGCWLWPSASYIKVGPRGSRQFLHRISLELKLGSPLGERHALHSCDTPRCCNPEHLRPGTHADNMRDMAARGRAVNKVVRGIENNKARHTDEEICAALDRMAAGESSLAVAADMGIASGTARAWRAGTKRPEAREKWLASRHNTGRGRAMVRDGWEECVGSASRNDGKPYARRRWVGTAT